ncbi:MAG: sigma-54 dependent transcriptional regulator [Myxococcota bacterium]
MSEKITTKHCQSVLIADDEPTILVSLRDALKELGAEVATASDGNAALSLLRSRPFNILISDIRMPGLSGMELLSEIKRANLPTKVVLITAYADVEQAVAAIKMGAHDYITKPFSVERVVNMIRNLCQLIELSAEVKELRAGLDFNRALIGKSLKWIKLLETVNAISESDSTVLISGESGTGKELVAKIIHKRSKRSDRPFVSVHCAALPQTLIESELFGHEQGAFTGALKQVKGRFESANGGVILLDEVDEIPSETQVKLLRVLQEKKIERIGSSVPIPVDVRVLATTKTDLESLVKSGRFRKDLYYRIAVIQLHLPTLAERPDDIPLLLQHFIAKFQNEMSKKIPGFTEEALDVLMKYDYPGNVRELEHIVEAACALSPGNEPIGVNLLPSKLRRTKSSKGFVLVPLREVVKDFERSYLSEALAKFNGSKSELADRLGISRKHLWEKLREHKLQSADDESL